MRKQAYIDPITDYLLHDPDRISAPGSLARGAVTASGIAGGGYAGLKGIDFINRMKLSTKPVSSKYKWLTALGLAGVGGGAGFGLGNELFSYGDNRRVLNKLDRIVDQLKANRDVIAKNTETVAATAPQRIKNSVPELTEKGKSVVDSIVKKLRPKSNFEKFKDSGADLWEALKDTGSNGWEALKDVVS